jgi:hypothetical protein
VNLSKPTKKQVLSDPALFATKFLKILDKDKNLVPFRYNKAQAHFQANRTGRDLILKARQLGFSTLVQGEMFRKTVTSTQTTITLAHDAETTQKLRRMADRFYEHCKFGDIQPQRKYANATLATYPEFDSTSTIATAGNVETGSLWKAHPTARRDFFMISVWRRYQGEGYGSCIFMNGGGMITTAS